MHRRWAAAAFLASAAGFSAVETSAVLAATSLLSATAVPHIQEYVASARTIKAAGDVRVIAVSILRLTFDVGRIGRDQRLRPAMLVSAGDVPVASTVDQRPWGAPLDGAAVQTLDAHLVDNAAGYTAARDQPSRWRGPYVDSMSADPWGFRYAVNVGLLGGRDGQAVLVLSAGPNGLVETPFAMVGLRQGGDDVVSVIGSGQ